MSFALGAGLGWRSGYGIVSILQFGLTLVLFLSLPLWKKRQQTQEGDADYEAPIGLRDALKIRGVKPILLAFCSYCMVETTAGLWTSTYLVEYRHIDTQTAAALASLFYIGITVGRALSGFLAMKLNDRKMILLGFSLSAFGIAALLLPGQLPAAAAHDLGAEGAGVNGQHLMQLEALGVAPGEDPLPGQHIGVVDGAVADAVGVDIVVIGDEQIHAALAVAELQLVKERDKIAADLVIGVHDLEILAGGGLQTGVDAGAVTAVLLMDNADDARILCSIAVADLAGGVLRAVVDDNDLHPLAAAEQGLDALFHVVLGIVAGHGNSQKLHSI